MKHLNGIVCAVLALACISVQASAQTGPVAIGEVLSAPTLAAYSPPAFSPDGKYLAYVVTDNARRRNAVDDEALFRTDLTWYGIASDIWISDLQTGVRRNITSGGNNWAPSWSPDGCHLAFLGDRSGGSDPGPARLWIWDRSSAKLRQAGDADVRGLGYSGTDWTADGRSVVVSMYPEELGRDAYAAAMKGKAPASAASSKESSTARIFEFDPSVPNAVPSTDQVNLDIWRRDIGIVDAQNGMVRRLVKRSRIGHYALAPDGQKIAYSVLTRAERPGTGQYLYQISTQYLRSGETRAVASDIRLTLYANSFSWSPNGEWIAYRTGGPAAADEIHVVAAAGGTARRIAHSPTGDSMRFEVDPPVWDGSRKNVFFLRDNAIWRAAYSPVFGASASPSHTRVTPARDTGRAVGNMLIRSTRRNG